jgi:formylglycine-generating enzyme required for sulfatase activity
MSTIVGLVCSTASAQITISTVSIGNVGNAAAPPYFNVGAVAYRYDIGRTEVTNAQYTAFLNAKATTDPFNLYNTEMSRSAVSGGIVRTGAPGSYTYSVIEGRGNHPVNWVSFWDACRFANWLHNGQGAGDTENGAYTLTSVGISSNTVTRNTGWLWAVASEDEWYKAAYHQPAGQGGDSDSYWKYTTSSNSVPTTAQANFGNLNGDTMPVGSFAPNFYGTYDMGGNVWEWSETRVDWAANTRIVRGGSFQNTDAALSATNRPTTTPGTESRQTGFRISHIPSPSSLAMLFGGVVRGLVRRRRRVGHPS